MTTFGLDLSSAHVNAWHAMLPADLKAVIRPDAAPALDDTLTPLVSRFATAAAERYLDLIEEYDPVLSSPEFGQGRRVRLMAFLIRVAWPDTGIGRTLVASGRAGETEGGAGDGEGGTRRVRGRFPALFLADHNAIETTMVRPRIARAVSDAETVEALANGLRMFEESGEGPSGGV